MTALDPRQVRRLTDFTTALSKLCQDNQMYIEANDDELVLYDHAREIQPFTLSLQASSSTQNTWSYAMSYMEVRS